MHLCYIWSINRFNLTSIERLGRVPTARFLRRSYPLLQTLLCALSTVNRHFFSDVMFWCGFVGHSAVFFIPVYNKYMNTCICMSEYTGLTHSVWYCFVTSCRCQFWITCVYLSICPVAWPLGALLYSAEGPQTLCFWTRTGKLNVNLCWTSEMSDDKGRFCLREPNPDNVYYKKWGVIVSMFSNIANIYYGSNFLLNVKVTVFVNFFKTAPLLFWPFRIV